MLVCMASHTICQQVALSDIGTPANLIRNERSKTIVGKIKRWGTKSSLKVCKWWSSPWNILDFTSLLLYFVAFSLSFYFPSASKIIMAIDAYLWIIKTSQFLRISPTLGPYINMIFLMVRQKP